MNRMMEDPLVLPADVIILSANEIDPTLLERMDWSEGDCVVTYRNARGSSHKIDADTARLLEQFREPRTILQAVFRHSVLQQREALDVLQSAFGVLSRLIQAHLLVLAESEDAAPLVAAFTVGARIDRFEVIRCVQFVDDTEVYQVRDRSGAVFALKIAGQRPRSTTPAMLEREEAVLRRLNGLYSPRLIDLGISGQRRYLVTEWVEGSNASVRADCLRKSYKDNPHPALIALCCEIAQAYAKIHAAGVLQSDIHPRNLLIASEGSVRIIDFGLANLRGASLSIEPAPRAGVGFFFEPEYARAKRLGEAEPAATPEGEQYQVAALIYFLLTRAHYLDFSLDRKVAYKQIELEAPRPFLNCGASPWPEVEQVLARALAKQPGARFPSMAEFERALREASTATVLRSDALKVVPFWAHDSEFLDSLIGRYRDPGGGLLERSPSPPACSVNYGAAGIAYMFYRLACIRGSADLLARSDLWTAWADQHSAMDGAFHSPDLQLTRELVGPVSLYHTAAGVHCVQGLINQAMGDVEALSRSVREFVAASSSDCENLDLTLGRASSLIGCVLLYEALPPEDGSVRPMLTGFANAKIEGMCATIGNTSPIKECRQVRWLGMAHGWAGILYAIMRWCRASGQEVPEWVGFRLDEIATLAQTSGKGVFWKPRLTDTAGRGQPGWCHGCAGYIHLWSLAESVFQGNSYLELAEKAAWHIWNTENQSSGNLCCGLAGEAYALLHLFKRTGQQQWVERARELGRRSLKAASFGTLIPGSLYKGDVGVALLTADLAEPQGAAMPMFESEGWPVVHQN